MRPRPPFALGPIWVLIQVLLVLALDGPRASSASGPGPLPPYHLEREFVIRQWDTGSGLADTTARSMAQTRDGFVWIGTFGGVGRLDGTTPMETLSLRSVAGASNEACIVMVPDRAGRLWIGGEGELILREENRWRAFHPDASWPGGSVESMVETPEGDILFGAGTALYQVVGKKISKVITPVRESDEASPWRPAFDAEGTLWLRSDTLLFSRRGGVWRTERIPDRGQEKLNGVFRARRGGVWISDATRIRRVVQGAVMEEHRYPADFRDPLISLLEDDQGWLWVGGFLQGLIVYSPDGAERRVLARQGLSHTHITSLLQDAEGNVFVGQGAGGALQLTHRRVRMFMDDLAESSASRITSVTPGTPGEILLANDLGQIYRRAEGQLSLVAAADPPGSVQTVCRTRDGTIWAGIESRGLARVRGTHLELVGPVGPEGEINPLALHEDRSGQLWIGTEHGYYLGRNGSFTHVPEGTHPDLYGVAHMAEGPGGEMYLESLDSVFRVTPAGLSKIDVVRETPETHVSALAVDAATNLWVSFRRGGLTLVRPDGRQFAYLAGHGIPAYTLSPLLLDGQGGLWGASSFGLNWIDTQVLQAVAEGRAPGVHPIRLGREDGLALNNTRSRCEPGAIATPDGELLFATPKGLASVTRRSLTLLTNQPPTLIREIFVDNLRLYATNGALSLPAGTRATRVTFTAASLTAPERVLFQYRVNGGSAAWSQPSTQRYLDLYHLAPTTYEVEVRSCNSDGIWNATPARVRLSIPPFYWQTLPFRLSLGVAVAGLLALATWDLQRRRLAQRRERVEREEQLLGEKARSAALIDATSDLVMFLDPLQKVTFVNRAGLALLGQPAAPPDVELDPEGLLMPNTLDGWRQVILSTLSEKGIWVGPLALRGPSGEPLPTAAVVMAHRNKDQTIQFYSAVCRDLREENRRRELEGQLQQAHKMEALGTLAGGIAHDFNNILTAITGNTQLAMADLPPHHPTQSLLADVHHGAQRAAELVRHILTFSRQQDHNRRPVDLEPIIHEGLNLLRVGLPSSIRLATRFASPLPSVLADPTEIHQIVVNLGSNAIHAMRGRSGLLTMSVSVVEIPHHGDGEAQGLRPGPHVRLQVSDTGEGIPPAVVQRIFDPFFTTKPPGEGTGLGLAVVHGIMKKLGGGVSVESRPGAGSTFTLLFPALNAPAPPSAAPPRSSQNGKGELILVVDDEEPVIFLTKRVLTRLGYRSETFTDPVAALQVLEARADEFSAVITDLSMPKMMGFDLASRILSIRRDLPVILTSGYIRAEDQAAARELGITQLVQKPNTVDELSSALSRAIHPPSGARQTQPR